MPIASINPTTGETVKVFPETSEAEIDRRLTLAVAAQQAWRKQDFSKRAALLRRAAGIMEAEQQTLAEFMTLEMGKPIRAAREEALKCATGLRYYADHGEAFLSPRNVDLGNDEEVMVAYQPLGVILAVMPWNFPFWQVVRFAAPALAAGNAALLKHASNVPQCALAIEDIFTRAGFPEGVFQTLLIPASRVDAILCDDRIAAVSLTGSESAGSQVAATAGRNIRKSVLELGGSDAFVVLASVDAKSTALQAARARTVNSGQSCIAAKRFIVVDSIADEFQKHFTDAMAALRLGDPMEEGTDIGPLATEQVLQDVERQVRDSVSCGARIATGGARLARPGYFFPPTVLIDVPRNASAVREEVFGPVAPVLRVRNATEALAVANDSRFGLGASVWTQDRKEADLFCYELQAGMVFVNGIVHSDPRLPFGGVKKSGYGREVGDVGMHEFMNIKTIRVRGVQEAGS